MSLMEEEERKKVRPNRNTEANHLLSAKHSPISASEISTISPDAAQSLRLPHAFACKTLLAVALFPWQSQKTFVFSGTDSFSSS